MKTTASSKQLGRVLACAACVLALAAQAQALDPTRPSGAPAQGARNAPNGESTSAVDQPMQPRIEISGKSRQFVVIGDRVVHVGETYNGAKLKAITAAGPVWQRSAPAEPDLPARIVKAKPAQPLQR